MHFFSLTPSSIRYHSPIKAACTARVDEIIATIIAYFLQFSFPACRIFSTILKFELHTNAYLLEASISSEYYFENGRNFINAAALKRGSTANIVREQELLAITLHSQ